MSSSFKRSSRKKNSQAPETRRRYSPIYIKHRLAAVKKQKKSIQSLCDNDSSSPEVARPFFLRSANLDNNSVDKSSDEDVTKMLEKRRKSTSTTVTEDSENDYDKKKMSEEYSKSDKHRSNMKSKKVCSTNLRKDKNKNKESDSSDSEDEITETHAERKERKERKPLTIKSKERDFINLHKEEADSSSGKEFQKSKISHADSKKIIKKVTPIREDCAVSTDSNAESATQIGRKSTTSKEQNLLFKSGVVKILNKLREVCTKYELQIENVKCKNLKKELMYQESACNIVEKSKNVIDNFKMELDAQEKKLVDFYEEWNKNCRLQNRVHEDSSSSENETLKMAKNSEKSDKSKSSSNTASIVSGCDTDDIFSNNEEYVAKANVDENDKNEDSIIEKSMDTDNEKSNQVRETSPILGSNKEKGVFGKPITKDNSNDKVFKECQSYENEQIDESIEDIFDETTIENIDISNFEEKEDKCENENNLESKEVAKNNDNKNEEITTEHKGNDSCICSEEMPELNQKNKNNVSHELDEEEQAKRLMLESDSETPANDDSVVEGSAKKCNEDENSKKESVSQSEEIKLDKKEEKNKTRNDYVCEDSLSDRVLFEQGQIMEVEACAKRTLLESNSDDSMSPVDTKKSTNKKQDSDDNSDLSCSDNDSKTMKLQTMKTNCSSIRIKEEDEEDSSEDKKILDSKQQVSLVKENYTGSDRKLNMSSEVVIERLLEKDLEKYKDALEKSQQYLESKEFRSLIDLDRLNRNCKNTSDATRSPLFRTSKKAKVKDAEDSLLDHLKKVEDGVFVENTGEDSNTENDNTVSRTETSFQSTEELMREADAATKNILLYSSDSDIDEQKIASEDNDSEKEEEEKNTNTTKSKDRSQQQSEKAEKKDSDKGNEDEWEKKKWRRDKVLTMKLSSDSDSDAAREKWNKKRKELEEKAEESHTENSVTKNEVVKRRRRNRRKIMDSDSDIQESNNSSTLEDNKPSDSDSSVGKKKAGRKRKTRKSSDTDSSFAEKRTKPKRKRIKNMSSDSDDSDDPNGNSPGTPGKKGRKNIRKVMKDKQVADDTKQAAKEEEERLRRIAERQKLYNEMYEARLAGEEKIDKLVLDFNPETKEELVTVHESLVKRLKPHQAKGIKFMWDACFESLERVKTSTGSGCIIAHCMGLGKTLQVITLVHTLLEHEEIGVKTIMIVCPLSTVLNWVNEFNLWLKDVEDNDMKVYEMTKLKKNLERKYQLEHWQRTGGVLIIGYEMFRNLSGTNNKMKKNMKESILHCLIDPGPDVIVCDEGHLLKNEDTALSKSIKRIKTLRRIVLTGTPLQNNLIEYHCMVQFVKPNLLGTKKEFLNRFANPITNGQFDDSTEYDVKLMKKRAYVLHKMLKGCVQRFDYSVLTPFLPPKQEYVIFVSLTEVQINMYRHYLENFAGPLRNASGALFADFQALQRIWTHPIVLRLNAEKIERMNEKKLYSSDSEGSLRDFIHDSETESATSTSSNDTDDEVQTVDSNSTGKNSRNTRSNKSEVEIDEKPEESEKKDEEWWLQFTQPEHFDHMNISSKLMLLFGILRECEQIGDKVLVFSQSLYSLTLIEQFLEKIDNETQNGTSSEFIDGHTGSWSLGLDYFRLDGQTSAENRNIWCKIFNKPSNTRARLFLISTRAGGLGINLTAANRVIIFDASWNPSHDVQSIFRVYRFGQKKPCYVYRFLAAGTMEEKIYNRQVTKLSLSCRVVDIQQIERHYSNHDLNELYSFEPNTTGVKKTLNLPKDRLLAEIFLKYKNYVENYHEHDSLLENKAEEELNEEERKQAWLEYEEEKKGKPPPMPTYSAMAAFPNHLMLNQFNVPSTFNISTDYDKLRELLRKDYPNASPETQQMMATRVLTDMYSYWEQQAYHNAANQSLDQMRTQMPNLARMNYVVQNTNKNLTNQPKDYRTTDIRPQDPDDDIVEVASSTASNKNKNQEE